MNLVSYLGLFGVHGRVPGNARNDDLSTDSVGGVEVHSENE